MEKRKALSIQEVISTNHTFYHALKADTQSTFAGEKEKIQQRLSFPVSYSEFRDLFIAYGTYCLYRKNQPQGFIIDRNNEPTIEQLYLYVTNNPSFDGDLHKGIMLQGKYGCGKTAILETYTIIHNHIVQRFGLRLPLFTFIKSVSLQDEIIRQSIKPFMYRPLVIDEFGREAKTVQDYGNILRPVSELLSVRSDIGALTHGTTNFTLERLSTDDFYGGMIGDRLRMMFNFITVTGDSRRK